MDLASHWTGDSGVPVVCLSAFTTDRAVTALAFDGALAAVGGLRRCYLDLPGHGESPAGPLTSDGVLGELLGFLDRELGGRRYLLAGWSYGSYLAAAVARRRPAGVAGMLLVCPTVVADMAARDLPGAAADADEPGWLDDVAGPLREHLGFALGNRTRAVAGRVSEVLTGSSPGDEEYRERLRADGFRLSDEDSAARYGGPVTMIAGRQDQTVGYADQFRRVARYPAGTFAVLDRAGHYLPFEQPEALAALIAEWRARCPAAPSI